MGGGAGRRTLTRAAGLSVCLAALLAFAAPASAADWTQRALGLQFSLSNDVPLRNAPWVYTHNSFNSRAEMGPTLSSTDQNQKLSIAGQLDAGVRHLEIDEHLFVSPRDPRVGLLGPVVCHALENGTGCSVEKPLVTVLREVRRWMDAHPGQVLMIYLESHLGDAAGYRAGADEVREALGGRIWMPPSRGSKCDSLPLGLTRNRIRAAGKQVLLMGPCGVGSDWRSYVFDETPRVTGSDNAAFKAFPSCGPDFKRAEYQRKVIRYYEDSTQLTRTTNGGRTDPVTAALTRRMTACGVDLIGFDQLTAGDPRLTALVWSWAPGQPKATGGCALARGDGRWEARPCGQRHHAACRDSTGRLRISARAARAAAAPRLCGKRLRTAVPRTGYGGTLLRLAQKARGNAPVWLAYRRSGSSWRQAERSGCGPRLRSPRRRVRVRHGTVRVKVRIWFPCTGEPLKRKMALWSGNRLVRLRSYRAKRVRVGRRVRRLAVRYRFERRLHRATVRLKR